MLQFSFRDLLKISSLTEFTEIDLLNEKFDPLLKDYVYALGINTDYPVEYAVHNHRDMAGNTGIGFRVLGEIRIDSAYVRSPLCGMIERLVVAGMTDISLQAELAEMLNRTVDMRAFSYDDSPEDTEEDFPTNMIEKDYEESSKQMDLLMNMLLAIRGTNIIQY